MKRAIMVVEIPSGQSRIAIDIQEPGIIRGFALGLRPKKILSPLEIPNVPPGQQMAEEVPVLLVEVDPDAPVRRRYLALIETAEVLKAEGEFEYRATAASRNGRVFHVFEGIDVRDENGDAATTVS